MKISEIEGIGHTYAEKLTREGVRTTQSLLNKAAHRKGRKDLSLLTGIPERMILNWVNRADLMRVPGIGSEYSDLLEAAGVDTVRELGMRRPENLHRTLLEVNQEKGLVRRPPSLVEIRRWVANAKNMLPQVTH